MGIFKIERYITVRSQFEGLHRWKDAPEEVMFLRSHHRHIFRIHVTIQITGNDRELEYFMVLNRLNKFLQKTFSVDKPMDASCEMIGEIIIHDFLVSTYGSRFYTVEVSEDGENSAIIKYQPVNN